MFILGEVSSNFLASWREHRVNFLIERTQRCSVLELSGYSEQLRGFLLSVALQRGLTSHNQHQIRSPRDKQQAHPEMMPGQDGYQLGMAPTCPASSAEVAEVGPDSGLFFENRRFNN